MSDDMIKRARRVYDRGGREALGEWYLSLSGDEAEQFERDVKQRVQELVAAWMGMIGELDWVWRLIEELKEGDEA